MQTVNTIQLHTQSGKSRHKNKTQRTNKKTIRKSKSKLQLCQINRQQREIIQLEIQFKIKIKGLEVEDLIKGKSAPGHNKILEKKKKLKI